MMISCKTCVCSYDPKYFTGCPECLQKKWIEPRRPRTAARCCLEKCRMNGREVEAGEEFYTDGTPGCAFCSDCAERLGIKDFPRLKAVKGKVWTAEDVRVDLIRS